MQDIFNIQLPSLKQNLSLKQAQAPALSSGSVQQLLSDSINFRPFSPSFATPTIRTPKAPPILKPIDLDNKKLMDQIMKSLKKKKMFEIGLLPDFTARIVGLPSEKITVEDGE